MTTGLMDTGLIPIPIWFAVLWSVRGLGNEQRLLELLLVYLPTLREYRQGATIAKRVPATTLTPSVFLFSAYAMAAVSLA